MQIMMPALFLQLSPTALAVSAAILALLAISLWAARNDLAKARGLDKVVALSYLCFATPLAAFGAEHLAFEKFLLTMVPSYMPWRVFWVYFVGVALVAAALSIATRIQVQWSGLLVGVMMFLFVAMLYLPGALRTNGRFNWTVVFRESSFGGAGWVLAGVAMAAAGDSRGKPFIAIGRMLIALAAIFFGIEHFLHPFGLPAVPLQKQMPEWIPARATVDYLTGAFLIAGGICFLLARWTRAAATWLAAWILLLVIAIYVPVMIAALASPSADVQLEGLNYFADTILFAGVILSLARASPDNTEPMNPRPAAALLVLFLLPVACLAQTSSSKVEDIGAKFSTTVVEYSFGTTTATTSRLRGQIYYLEPETLKLPKFENLTPVGVIYTNGLNIPPRQFTEGFPGVTDRFEWFAIDYTGRFYVQQSGKYAFVLVSDDGAKLYIDRRVVINNDGRHPPLRLEGSIKLDRGLHDIRLSYFQGPRFQIALMLGVRPPGVREWRFFNTDEFLPPANPEPRK